MLAVTGNWVLVRTWGVMYSWYDPVSLFALSAKNTHDTGLVCSIKYLHLRPCFTAARQVILKYGHSLMPPYGSEKPDHCCVFCFNVVYSDSANKQERLCKVHQCCFNAGPSSATLAHDWNNTRSMFRSCRTDGNQIKGAPESHWYILTDIFWKIGTVLSIHESWKDGSVNIVIPCLRRFLHNHGNSATEGSPKNTLLYRMTQHVQGFFKFMGIVPEKQHCAYHSFEQLNE